MGIFPRLLGNGQYGRSKLSHHVAWHVWSLEDWTVGGWSWGWVKKPGTGFTSIYKMVVENGMMIPNQKNTGWWFQTFFYFTSIWGRFPFWLLFFKRGWFNHQPDKKWLEITKLALTKWLFGVPRHVGSKCRESLDIPRHPNTFFLNQMFGWYNFAGPRIPNKPAGGPGCPGVKNHTCIIGRFWLYHREPTFPSFSGVKKPIIYWGV